jgi:Raf kinase inhibitor-like YbhB/YbcL family protein
MGLMLQKIPTGVGRALREARTDAEEFAIADTEFAGVSASIDLSSSAFDYNEPIPAEYTADGDGRSPPLEWRGVPPNAEAVVLLIEDADSATPQPFVHAMVWDLPGVDASLPEGALQSVAAGAARKTFDRSSCFAANYAPPAPPRSHGRHRYAFQVLALDSAPRFDSPPTRAALLEKIRGHVIAKGLLIGTYERF